MLPATNQLAGERSEPKSCGPRLPWPFRGFPATQRETRGSPALCVSGSFQGNQRVFGAPFCFSRVSLGKLASFPESESCSGAKSEAKLRKSARYPGVFQVYPGFVRYTRIIPGILPILLILAPKQPQTRLRARTEKWMVSPWSFPRKLEGAVGKLSQPRAADSFCAPTAGDAVLPLS